MGTVNRNRLAVSTSTVLSSETVFAFNLNNPGQSNRFYNPSATSASNVPELGASIYGVEPDKTVTEIVRFQSQAVGVGSESYDMSENLSYNQPDPMGIFLKNVRLRFFFTGDQSDMHVFITVVRQKKLFTPLATNGAQDSKIWESPWEMKTADHVLPTNARAFLGCAGTRFTNRVDPNSYEILATKRFKIDNLYETKKTDDGVPVTVSAPTTGRERVITMNVPINRSFKPLAAPFNQFAEVYQTTFDKAGPYRFDNQHPLSNIWCIMTNTEPKFDDVGATPVYFNVQMSHTWVDKSGSVR